MGLNKYTVQTLGFALIVVGIILFLLGLLGGPGFGAQEYPLCAVPGCPLPLPWWWWIPSASFFSGIALVIIGIILLIVARRMKPDQKTNNERGAVLN